MQVLLKQKNKDLYSGEFEIFNQEELIGNIWFNGSIDSMEANISGTFYDKKISLNFVSKILTGTNKKFRPYKIIENNNIEGEIFHTEYKKNIFSKYGYTKCLHNQKEYELYSIGLGKKSVCCLYCGEQQIAQIEKDGIIYNDLHNYDIYSIDKDGAFIAVLMSCYMYITSCYNPGIKVTKSINKIYSKTINKDLISKYNVEWINNIK
jgi:hypothetical protein